MGRTLINELSEIEWTSDFTCSIETTGIVTIDLKGNLSGANLTASEVDALIPAAAPSDIVGATYAGILTLGNRSFTKDDSGFVEVTATYKGTQEPDNPVGGPGGDTDVTRYEIRGQAVERDIATHPEFEGYSDPDRQNIALLLSGVVYPNPAYTNFGTGITSWEFIREDKEKVLQVLFDDEAAGLTALEMARRIARGVRTYYAPTITASRSYSQRNPFSGIANLAKIQPSLQGVSTPTGRDWLFSGFTQSNVTSNSYDISEEYLLSDEGGIDPLIYD